MADLENIRRESERDRQEYRTSEAYTTSQQGQLETALKNLSASQAKYEASYAKWQADREAAEAKWQAAEAKLQAKLDALEAKLQAEKDASKANQEGLIRRMDKYEKYRLTNLLSLALVWLKNIPRSKARD